MQTTTTYSNLPPDQFKLLVDHYINRSKSIVKAIDDITYKLIPECRVQYDFNKFIDSYIRM